MLVQDEVPAAALHLKDPRAALMKPPELSHLHLPLGEERRSQLPTLSLSPITLSVPMMRP